VVPGSFLPATACLRPTAPSDADGFTLSVALAAALACASGVRTCQLGAHKLILPRPGGTDSPLSSLPRTLLHRPWSYASAF